MLKYGEENLIEEKSSLKNTLTKENTGKLEKIHLKKKTRSQKPPRNKSIKRSPETADKNYNTKISQNKNM